MNVLKDIPFSLDQSDFQGRIHLDRFPDSMTGVQELLNAALPFIRPKALYKVSFIGGRTGSTVQIGQTLFSSEVLSRNLREVERVFPYVATCGTELEALESGITDLFTRFCLDTLKEMALLAARNHLLGHLQATYGVQELSSMNPGSGNTRLWPIGQQRPLFDLLGDVEGAIGVRLTPSFLMVPNKSVSGILFPAEVHFESCQLCTRENCPRRRAPYSGEPAETLSPAHP
jgi:hypothetical protein